MEGNDLSDVLQLRVIWPDERAVLVDVRFERRLLDLLQMPRVDVRGLEDDDVASPEAIRAFLRRATRATADGETVKVLCWTAYRDRVYEQLGIDGGDDPPHEIELPDG